MFWYIQITSLGRRCCSVDHTQLSTIGLTIQCHLFLGFHVLKVTCYLWGLECVMSFCFQVWSDIWKTRKDVQKHWLMRMEQSQSVERFDCTEWHCQWWFLHTQTCWLIFKVVLFMQLSGVLVCNTFVWPTILAVQVLMTHSGAFGSARSSSISETRCGFGRRCWLPSWLLTESFSHCKALAASYEIYFLVVPTLPASPLALFICWSKGISYKILYTLAR